MPGKNVDLHGSAPDKNKIALLLIDVINDFDFRRTVEHCARSDHGSELVRLLHPEENDYFVLKPKHSGFFSTTLETLLRYLETQTLILTGIAGNFCVLFTAN